jgi:hypothetical protein
MNPDGLTAELRTDSTGIDGTHQGEGMGALHSALTKGGTEL